MVNFGTIWINKFFLNLIRIVRPKASECYEDTFEFKNTLYVSRNILGSDKNYHIKSIDSTEFLKQNQIQTLKILLKKENEEEFPNVSDSMTINTFAKMAANAYHNPLQKDAIDEAGGWRNVDPFYEHRHEFGWTSDGLRGYIFANKKNSIVVISFKGTSPFSSDTIYNDKYMDNLMFSCCCAKVDITWKPICGCANLSLPLIGNKYCDKNCLEKEVKSEKSYYREALKIYQACQVKYPSAKIWVTGHSLGGAIAGLLAVSMGRGTVAITFASPGYSLYAKRLGIKLNAEPKIWNFGVSTDPIYMAKCQGPKSICYISGYAIETLCRPGYDCTYILPSQNMDITTHRIDWMLDRVLLVYSPPLCYVNSEENCKDCKDWIFL